MSVIPRHSPLNTHPRSLLEDVAHQLFNSFDTLPTKISHPDVQHSISIQRSPIGSFISTLGPHIKLWGTCSSMASLNVATKSTTFRRRESYWKKYSQVCWCAGLHQFTLRMVVANFRGLLSKGNCWQATMLNVS